MATVAALPPRATTDLPQVFSCKGATGLQINVSVAGVYLAFAPNYNNVVQGFGVEEFHSSEILVINDEPIGAVQYRSAVPGTPATISINASN